MKNLFAILFTLMIITSTVQFCTDNINIGIEDILNDDEVTESFDEINNALFEIGKAIKKIEHGVGTSPLLKNFKEGYRDTLGDINPDTIIETEPTNKLKLGEVEWAEDPFK